MGRFETTVEFYDSREPYPTEFFAAVAARMGLSGREKMIDLGCGPAQLAIGFAPYVQNSTGVDIEPGMLHLAAKNARKAGVELRLLESRVEDLPATAGVYEVVTIGRALHWMDRAGTLAVLDRMVAADGWIAICGSTADVSVNGWAGAYQSVRRRWMNEEDEKRYRIDYAAWCAGSRFRRVEEVRVKSHRTVTVDEIERRALSMSSTAPAVLGERRAEFAAELRSSIAEFARDGQLEETLFSVATLLR
jgi:SAM-dependent methyltransferase